MMTTRMLGVIIAAAIFTGSAAAQQNYYYHGKYLEGAYPINDESIQFSTFTFKGELTETQVAKAAKAEAKRLKEKGLTRDQMQGYGNTAQLNLGDGKVLVLLWYNGGAKTSGWIACNNRARYIINSGRKGNVPSGDWVEADWEVNGFVARMWLGRNGDEFLLSKVIVVVGSVEVETSYVFRSDRSEPPRCAPGDG